MDFLAAFGGALGTRRRELAGRVATQLPAVALPADFNARQARFEAVLAAAPGAVRYSALQHWSYTHHGPIAIESFEEVRAELAPALEALRTRGPTTLELAPGDAMPAYCRDVEFHGTGSWDGHDHMGFIHGELVHRRLVARNFGGDIYEQRRGLLRELARPAYGRILEIGTSAGNFTVALAREFPQAEITGIDVSRRMLEQAQRIGNELGCAWRLCVRAAERTGFEDAAFDLVAGYALGHEVPAGTMRAILREAYRVLEPGGELLLGDVVPFRAQDPLQQCWAQHEADHGGEPWWREFASLDLAAEASAAGFERARYLGHGPRRHPFFLHACKPGAAP
jgi:SAM-dependent methyltransferase